MKGADAALPGKRTRRPSQHFNPSTFYNELDDNVVQSDSEDDGEDARLQAHGKDTRVGRPKKVQKQDAKRKQAGKRGAAAAQGNKGRQSASLDDDDDEELELEAEEEDQDEDAMQEEEEARPTRHARKVRTSMHAQCTQRPGQASPSQKSRASPKA